MHIHILLLIDLMFFNLMSCMILNLHRNNNYIGKNNNLYETTPLGKKKAGQTNY